MKMVARALALAALVTLFTPVAGAQPSAQRFAVPSTVSSEAARSLRAFYGAVANSPKPTRPATFEEWDRRQAESEGGLAMLGKPIVNRLKPSITRELLGGVPVLRIRPSGWRSAGRLLVYTHGGGYVSFSATSTVALAASMAAATGNEVISIDYTLAPRGKWRAVTDEVVAVWRALLSGGANPAHIGFFGDSAGGGLAAGSILKMRDENLPLPGALVLISPWSDITATGDTYDTLGSLDPVLDLDTLRWSADAYADRADQKNPYVSPVYGDYRRAFPPTLIQAGTREMFLSNAVRQYQAIRGGGHEASLDIYEGMPHAFHYLAGGAPETRAAYARAAEFLHSRLGSVRRR